MGNGSYRLLQWVVIGVDVMVCGTALGGNRPYFEVTVTNLTRGQTFTPILVASHRPGIQLFTPGEPASAELATLAEGGDVGPLKDLLGEFPETVDVADSGGPLPPENP